MYHVVVASVSNQTRPPPEPLIRSLLLSCRCRCPPAVKQKNRRTSAFPGFDPSSALYSSGALAAAFSPDGSILYISTNVDRMVWATNSSGTDLEAWGVEVPDLSLCAITVSPDGLSVRYFSGYMSCMFLPPSLTHTHSSFSQSFLFSFNSLTNQSMPDRFRPSMRSF